MKKIILISDTHGNKTCLDKLIPLMEEADLILFAGDGLLDFYSLPVSISQKVKMVRGNCDSIVGQKDICFDVENRKFLLTHGDTYGVKYDFTVLYLRAKSLGANVVCYGHTHMQAIFEENGILFINPGTLSRYALKKTFAYIVVNGDKVTATINEKFFEGM